MPDQRGGQHDPLLETNLEILFIYVVQETRVEGDRDAPFVFRRELTHGKTANARGGFPINVPQIILWLVVTQRKEVMPRPAPDGGEVTGVKWQQMQLVANRLWLWINRYVHVARAQTAAMTKEAERETGRELESVDEYMPAFGKCLFDPLLRGGPMRNVSEIGQIAFAESPAGAFPLCLLAHGSARFHQNRKRWQQVFRIA